MAFGHTLAIGALESIPAYLREFKPVFNKTRVDIDPVMLAIAAFKTTLATPNSRFHQGLGQKDALGGNSFHKVGMVQACKASSPAEGCSAVTGKEIDRFSFKVPILRNVQMTWLCFPDRAADIQPTLQRTAVVAEMLPRPAHMTADPVQAGAPPWCPASRAPRCTACSSSSCASSC